MLKTFLSTASTLTLGILCLAGSAIASEPSSGTLNSAAEPSAAEEKQESAEPAPEIRRVITGRVFDEIGNGVAGARVWLRSAARNKHVAETETDASGRFTLESPIESGRVVLRAEHPDYAPYHHGRILSPPPIFDPAIHQPEKVSITLVEGAEIRGRLLGLEAERRGPVFFFATRDPSERAISGDWVEGDRYEFRHVPVGRWTIKAATVGGTQVARAQVEVSSQARVVEQDLDFRPGVSFSGTVHHEQGLDGQTSVTLSQEDGSFGHGMRVDEQGKFRASGLPRGLYEVFVVSEDEPYTERFLVDLQSDRKMDIDITPALLFGQVSGRNDAPIRISIRRLEPHKYVGSVKAEEDGSFQQKLPPGRYRLLFTQQGSRIEERIVDLAPGSGPATGEEIRGLEVELSPAEPWKVRLELPSSLVDPDAVLVLEREDGVQLWHGRFNDLGDEALPIPVRPHGENWRLLIYVQRTAAKEIPASGLRQELTTVELDPSAVIVLQGPVDELPTMDQYLRKFKLRVLSSDGRIYRQPRPRSMLLENEWSFHPYRRMLGLTYLPEGDWILELTSPEGDIHKIPVTTTEGRVTEMVRDFP